MSRKGTFVDKTITDDTILELKDCGDVFIENNGQMTVFFSKKAIGAGQNFRPTNTAIFDDRIELKFIDPVIGVKEVYISYVKYHAI